MQLINDYSLVCREHEGKEFLVTDEVIKIIGLIPKNVILKCGPYHFPITIHRISSNKAIVILQVSDLTTDVFTKYDSNVEIRFYTKRGKRGKPNFFFIAGKALLPTAHPDIELFSFFPIIFNESCPKLLIDLLLPLFNISDSVKNRRDHRISIPLGKADLYDINARSCYIAYNNRLHLTVICDISISGAHLMMLADQLSTTSIVDLHLATMHQNEMIILKCEVVKSSKIKKELLSLSVKYVASTVSDRYRIFFKKALEAEIIGEMDSKNG